MFYHNNAKIEPDKNHLIRFFQKFMPVTPNLQEDIFFIIQNGKRFATHLFLVLILIETTDLIFAVDIIPAILAITQDQFIVYTSNVFAILGLGSLYFALAGLVHRIGFELWSGNSAGHCRYKDAAYRLIHNSNRMSLIFIATIITGSFFSP